MALPFGMLRAGLAKGKLPLEVWHTAYRATKLRWVFGLRKKWAGKIFTFWGALQTR